MIYIYKHNSIFTISIFFNAKLSKSKLFFLYFNQISIQLLNLKNVLKYIVTFDINNNIFITTSISLKRNIIVLC